jgi:hypothetical protein
MAASLTASSASSKPSPGSHFQGKQGASGSSGFQRKKATINSYKKGGGALYSIQSSGNFFNV